MSDNRIKLRLKPVTPIPAKCKECTLFNENFGDPYCEHKGCWFEAYHFDTGQVVERQMITGRKIRWCKKHTPKDKPVQRNLF